MSPTIFRRKGFRFFFFSREELRSHVHVHHVKGEAKFWLEPEIELAQNYGLSARRLNMALELSGGTNMRSALPGKSTSEVEVTNVSRHGFWLLIEDRELFLPVERFPWFRDVPIGQLLRVEQPHATHLYWPELDIDLAVESIEFPERFPLVSGVSPGKAQRRPRATKGRTATQ